MFEVSEAYGFAVVGKGGSLLVDTVSPTERAAKVNWMCVYAGTLAMESATDSQISERFDALSKAKRVQLVRVKIEVAA